MDKYNKAVNYKLSKSCKAGENVLIILERNVDVPTVLLHSMTVEALVHDILPVEKGFYKVHARTRRRRQYISASQRIGNRHAIFMGQIPS